ncbi:MAG: sulfite exporter TauE/SafE family protein [Candidatus Omnitrophica bacterium]|nr:sulfite exporter TauE/SafE family protein [Candidatus Omnitrophota bacterium]
MLATFIIQPLLVGLSLGAFCLSYCFPFLSTFVASDPRSVKENAKLIVRFIFGRLLGYIMFGIIFGFLGEKLQSPLLTLATDLSLIFISFILILYLCGLLKQQEGNCPSRKFQNQNAMMMGFFMGINICPPFLLSLPYVFSLHSTWLGVLYFLIFFVSSSIFFLPMIFVGMLARIKEFQLVARISGFICAGIFIAYGAYSIIHTFIIKH